MRHDPKRLTPEQVRALSAARAIWYHGGTEGPGGRAAGGYLALWRGLRDRAEAVGDVSWAAMSVPERYAVADACESGDFDDLLDAALRRSAEPRPPPEPFAVVASDGTLAPLSTLCSLVDRRFSSDASLACVVAVPTAGGYSDVTMVTEHSHVEGAVFGHDPGARLVLFIREGLDTTPAEARGMRFNLWPLR